MSLPDHRHRHIKRLLLEVCRVPEEDALSATRLIRGLSTGLHVKVRVLDHGV